MPLLTGIPVALEEIAELGGGTEWIGEVAMVALGTGLLMLVAVLVFVWLMVRKRSDVLALRAERDNALRRAESAEERARQLESRLGRRADRDLEQNDWDRQMKELDGQGR